MAKDTFNSYIQKNQTKYANRQEQIQQQQKDNAELSSILDEMATDSLTYETGSYSKQEVAEAAKSLLMAQPYKVDITHMDLTDNAVYYNTETKKSRGRIARKNIRDYGKMMIEKAKEVRELRKKDAEAQAVRDALVESAMEGLTLQTEDMSIGEWKREEGYEQKEAGFYSSDMFDKFKHISGYSEKMKNTFKGEMGSAVQERIKDTLSKDIPPFETIVTKLNEKMQRSFQNYAKDRAHSEQDIAKHKISIMKSYSKDLKVIESRYRDVKEGKVSPEAFKLFMDTAIFTYCDSNQDELYNTFVSTGDKQLSKEENDKKNKAVTDLIDVYQKASNLEEKNYAEKKIDERGTWKKNFLAQDPYKASVDKIAQLFNYQAITAQRTEKGINKTKAFLESNYVHFAGEKMSSEPITKRYYVTCKKDKHKEMLDAWATVMKRNEKISQRIKFKIPGDAMKDRKDNIVIYVPADVTQKEMEILMKDMSDECNANDILADDKDSMETAGKVFKGISTGPEFPVRGFFKTVINYGLYDQKDSSDFYAKMNDLAKKENKTITGNGNPPIARFSYNRYLQRAAFLAESIVRQNHGIGPDDSIDGDEGMMKEARTYFNDFIRLSGVDPATFDHLS